MLRTFQCGVRDFHAFTSKQLAYLKYNDNQLKHAMKYSEKENRETTDASAQPTIVAEREMGLSPKKKKLLEETMRRHDKAFKMLANM